MRAAVIVGLATAMAAVGLTTRSASADIFSDYEDLAEGGYGSSLTHNGVTYRDINNVNGFFPDGAPMTPGDLGTDVIVENAGLFYVDFPEFGSPTNALTFGSAWISGENLSIGALASVWMDLDTVGNAVSFDIGYYENGPWGTIEYRLEALRDGAVVGSDSFTIAGAADDPGRDNPTFSTMSLSGVEFDQLHLYAWLEGNYTGPRGMIDNLTITTVPEPASALAGIAGLGLLALRRRRAQH